MCTSPQTKSTTVFSIFFFLSCVIPSNTTASNSTTKTTTVETRPKFSERPTRPQPIPQSNEDHSNTDWIALWKQDKQRFTNTMQRSGLSNEEKMVVVRSIIVDPSTAKTPQLCSVLQGSDAKFCDKMLYRSHLWESSTIQQNTHSAISYIPTVKISLETIHPVVTDACTTENVWCITQQAFRAIQQNDIVTAQGYCEAIMDNQPNNTARDECYFSLAEMLISQKTDDAIIVALQTCAHTKIYQEHCYSHLTEILAKNTNLDILSTVPDTLTQIQQYFSNDPIFANKMCQYYATLLTVRKPNLTSVDTQDQNSALVLLFIQHQRSADKTIEEWKTLYQDFVTENQSLISIPMASGKNIRNMWNDVSKVNLPYRYYLSQSLRPYSKDIEEDWALALVAALQQQKFPTEKIKQSSNNAIIQWMLQHR